MPETRVGISGWTYAPWRGVFYPKGLPQNQELPFASRALNSIEINGTFYSLQRPSSFQSWYDQTPDDFVFSVKGGRFITHMKKLANVDAAIANFFASGVLALREKLGPFLWQLPPTLGFQPERIESFFKLLPHDTREAVKLAKRHDARLKGRSFVETDANRPVRHAMEVRHESFRTPAFIKLLRKHNVALVNADTAGEWPHMEDVTADFIYARLHGEDELYASGYTKDALDTWARKFKAWRSGKDPKDAIRADPDSRATKRSSRDVFVYFDNDVKVHTPVDAMGLAKRLGIRWEHPQIPVARASLPRSTTKRKVKPAKTATPRRRWPAIARESRAGRV